MKKKTLTGTLLETHNLLRQYNSIWYGKNFGGLDPWQGQGRILSALRNVDSISHLQRLEENGYIQRHRSTTDKRALIVELTEKGERFQHLKPDYDELFLNLTSTEKKVLMRSLEKISEQLNELIACEVEEDFF